MLLIVLDLAATFAVEPVKGALLDQIRSWPPRTVVGLAARSGGAGSCG